MLFLPIVLKKVGKIGNMASLTQDEYEEYKTLSVEEWLATRTSEQLNRHLLPVFDSYDIKNFTTFTEARKSTIESRLKSLIPVVETGNFGVV